MVGMRFGGRRDFTFGLCESCFKLVSAAATTNVAPDVFQQQQMVIFIAHVTDPKEIGRAHVFPIVPCYRCQREDSAQAAEGQVGEAQP